jgi:hypothetical protein
LSQFLKGHHTWKIHQLQSTYRWEGSFLPTMYTSHSACACNDDVCTSITVSQNLTIDGKIGETEGTGWFANSYAKDSARMPM